MINKELFLATIMSFPAEYLKFAHAYGTYDGELRKTKHSIVREGIKVDSGLEESEYSPNLKRYINWASSELFNLNKICKSTRNRNSGFINGFVDTDKKEELINEAYNIIISLSYSK